MHTLAALLHGNIGQTDDDDGGFDAGGEIYLHIHDDPFETDDGAGVHFSKHGLSVGGEVEKVNSLFRKIGKTIDHGHLLYHPLLS